MKNLKKISIRILQGILAFVVLVSILLYLTGNEYVFKGVKETYLKGYFTAYIDDHPSFDNNVVAKAELTQVWEKDSLYNQIKLTNRLRTELEDYQTAAFVVIKSGKLWHEAYWFDYTQDSKTNSFSMAKSVTTMLLGAAIDDGYINHLNQPITDFLPEFNDDELAKQCTVGDLAAMTAGFDWKEDYYFPINPTAKSYFVDDIEQQMLSRKFVKESGKEFEYLSGVTQLLGIVIKRATKKSLSSYLSEKFWQPLGMRKDALWSMDNANGIEKAYCCLNANAKDFAKLGQLLLQNGKWNGKQLLDSAFVKKMVTPNYKAFKEGEPAKYGYSVWTDYEHQPNFYAMLGHLGQRIIVIPEHELVIVRLGREKDRRPENLGFLPGNDIYYFVDEVVGMVQSKQ